MEIHPQDQLLKIKEIKACLEDQTLTQMEQVEVLQSKRSQRGMK